MAVERAGVGGESSVDCGDQSQVWSVKLIEIVDGFGKSSEYSK